MSLLLATCGESVAASDTFQMSRRQTLWPQLNTAESGTWAWSGSASKQFGGAYENSSAASGDYVEFANVPLFGANAKVNILYTKSSNGGIIKVYWNGSELGTLDTYNASTTYNNVSTVDLGTVSVGRGTLRLISDTKNASSSAYKISVQQIEVVQLTGTATGSSLDDLPWCVDVPPVSYDSTTGPVTLTQSTSTTWGSYVRLSDAINEYTEYKVWLAQGTYTMSMVSVNGTNGGIATLTIDGGSSLGTVDTYNGSTTYNNVGTITSISVATTGVHTVRLTAATKNASSGGYNLDVAWLQFRKTTTTGAITATGATYGRETLELWPWFADTTDSDTLQVNSAYLYYGAYYDGSRTIGNAYAFEFVAQPGTYSVNQSTYRSSSSGIAHLSNGGADLDTVDLYGIAGMIEAAMSGSLVSGTLTIAMDSKNAASSNYANYLTMIRLVRTGA